METELSRVVDALPGLVWTASLGGEIDFLNQQWFDYTGFSRDESYGKRWQAAVHPEQLDEMLGRWEAITGCREPGEMVVRLRRFDGAYRRFLIRVSPLTDAAGQVVKWCGVATEIEGTSLTEAVRRPEWWMSAPERETHFRAILDGLPALITLMTPAGELEFANRQTLEYFGATLDEAKRWTRATKFHPDDRPEAMAAWVRSVERGTPYTFVGRQRRADGMYRWFHSQGFPLRDADGAIVLWYLLETDIDNRKRAEALLGGEKRMLEMVARGLPLTVVLDVLCELIESTISLCRCSILLLAPGGTTYRQGSAPSLPPSFNAAFDGMEVDPADRTCGLAVTGKTQVIAADVAADPRWAASPWSGPMKELDLRSCWSTPILSGDGTVLGVLAMYQRSVGTPTPLQHDLIEQFITIAGIAMERAQNDAALKHSEARKAAILDSALDCIITIDHEGRITEFNPAAERTFGCRRPDVIGERLSDVIIPPSLREHHRLGLVRYLATGEARVIGKRIEMTAVRADGVEFPVELTVTRIASGGPPSFTGYLRDISERRTSEESLRRSEAYLAKAQTLSRTGSFGWKVATEEHFWSDETFRIFEYDRSTPVSLQAILQRVHPLDIQLVTQVIALAAEGVDFDYECRLLMPGGAVKHVHIVAHGTRSPNGDLEYIGAIQDVTERRLSEEALHALRTELAHVARVTSLGALTASIAHEVNQPLSGIVTNASTCLRMLATDPPNIDGARETARRTIRDGNRASDVVSRLRALFSKKRATIEPVDLNEATRDVIALSLRELQRGRVIVRAELADVLPPVAGDRVQLQQVILNLLLNAAEAMSGVEDRPRQLVIRTVRQDDGGARLTVQDSGVGFEPNSAERLFEAFYTTKAGGMGIGLSVSRSIIASHRGRLWATANDGPGATFSFSIPGVAEAALVAAPPVIAAGSSGKLSAGIT
jgi:PAS domain S-box-containing protein